MDVSAARTLLARATREGVTPAAVVEVGTRAGTRWTESFGRLSYDPHAPAARTSTIFDLASLTKVVATTSLAMRAVAEGRLDLDQPVGRWLDGWRASDRAGVRVRHLLDHSSGLPGHRRLWESATGRAAYEAALRAVPLERRPGVESVYSDLGFILLGFLLENARGAALDEQFRDLRTLWRGSTTFLPATVDRPRIAPTEPDAARGAFLQGEVHDENARALGGVAGHAGLFGTAGDIGAFARLALRSFDEDTGLASPSLMHAFAAPSAVPASSRALGWDTMRPTSSCGARMSAEAIGHTGFTGTSLWIDRTLDLYVVLLTNRVHPSRANDAHIALRRDVHDAIVSGLGR